MSSTGPNSRPGSRYNSPFPPVANNVAPAPATKSADASEKQQTKLDRWVEPDRAPPRSSFAEAGNVRHGVLKGMVPLGQGPTAKLLKSVMKGDSLDNSARESGPSSVSTPNERAESIATPEPASDASPSTTAGSGFKADGVESRPSSVVPVQPEINWPTSAVTLQEMPLQTAPGRSLSGITMPGRRASSAGPVQELLSGFTPVPSTRARSSTPVRVSRDRSATPVQGLNNRAPFTTPAPASCAPSSTSLHVEIPRHSIPSIPLVHSRPSSATSGPRSREPSAAPVQNVISPPVLSTSTSMDVSRPPTFVPVQDGPGRHPYVTPISNTVIPENPQSAISNQTGEAPGFTAPSAPQTPQLQTRPYTPVIPQNTSRPSTAPQPYAALPTGQSVFSAKPPGMSPVVMFPPPPQLGPNGEYMSNMVHTDRVVESAVQQALDEQHYPTAYALRTLYDDHRLNPRMVRLIDDIFNSRADDQQYTEFQNVMKHKKKEGKKDRTGEYYFNGDGSDPLPRLPSLPPHGSPYSTSDQGRRLSLGYSPISLDPEEDQHINKKHKANDIASSSNMDMDMDIDMDLDMDLDLDLDMNGDELALDSEVLTPALESATASGPIPVPVPAPPASTDQENGHSKMERSLSQSSLSSLSSVDEALAAGSLSLANSPAHKIKSGSHHTNAAQNQPSPLFAHPNANPLVAETHPSTGNSARPINAPKKTGPKLGFFSTKTAKPEARASNTPSSSATGAQSSSTKNPAVANTNSQRQQPASSSSAMPSATAVSSSQPVPVASKSRARREKDSTPHVTTRVFDENDTTSRLKRKVRETARENAGPIRESYERHVLPLLPEPGYGSDGGDSFAVGSSKGSKPKLRLNHNNKKTRQSQANNYDSDNSSPTILPFRSDLAPSSFPNSRAGTPSALNRPTRRIKTGTGLRVKTSPMKKNKGTAAGIPRASGERNSPTNGSFPNNHDDNDDYCSSCGGNGELVCCDGCTRAFHFKCYDPPMIPGDEQNLNEEWYCFVCQAKNNPRAQDEHGGPFGELMTTLDKKNPAAFHLPKDIRELFEDVKTGAEGEYEEIVPPKPKNPKGYDEAPDYFKLRDNKGNSILCHNCGGMAAAPTRAIIPCTYCGLSWHMDCVNPPMAKEPNPSRPFKCPAHVDDLIMQLPMTLAPAHRYRKKKNQSPIKPAFSRGVKNDGQIEVEFEASEDEEKLGFYDQVEYGKIYKLPEKGIKLDFITQIKRKFGEFPEPRPAKRQKTPPRNRLWSKRSLVEQQAALNLASLAIPTTEVGDRTKDLLQACLSQAPPFVVNLLAMEIADTMSNDHVSMLATLFEQASKIQRQNVTNDKPTLESSINIAEQTKDVEAEAGSEVAKKLLPNELAEPVS